MREMNVWRLCSSFLQSSISVTTDYTNFRSFFRSKGINFAGYVLSTFLYSCTFVLLITNLVFNLQTLYWPAKSSFSPWDQYIKVCSTVSGKHLTIRVMRAIRKGPMGWLVWIHHIPRGYVEKTRQGQLTK